MTSQHSVLVTASTYRGRPWLSLECATKGCDWEHEFTNLRPFFEDVAAIAEAHEQDLHGPGSCDTCGHASDCDTHGFEDEPDQPCSCKAVPR